MKVFLEQTHHSRTFPTFLGMKDKDEIFANLIQQSSIMGVHNNNRIIPIHNFEANNLEEYR